jgi:8-oxo-dGTP pyrophosphatase MutT (NUDIX family)
MGNRASVKVLQKPRLPKRRQQVAAVCYRIRKHRIEFLLVQTREGRWIFPKGGVEPGFTHAQSAALEAFEEAGVHGRMEEVPFARYYRRKRDTADTTTTFPPELAVAAHLCEVTRLETPQESKRNPTWFAIGKAKQRLREERTLEFGAELARVADRAAARVGRLRGESAFALADSKLSRSKAIRAMKDGLQGQ